MNWMECHSYLFNLYSLADDDFTLMDKRPIRLGVDLV